MSGFNILDLMNSKTKSSIEINVEEYTEITLEHEDIVITKHNKYSMESIQELATGIELVGELQQPLVLGRVNGEYRLSSGHRRYAAIGMLLGEGKEKYRKVKCRYKDMTETQFRMELLIGNTFNRKMSDYDLMMEAREWKEVLTDAKKEGLILLESGEHIRDYVAQILGKSTGKIGQLEAVNNNATEGIKEQLKSGNIGITTAHAASQLSEEKQKEIVSQAAAGQDIKSEEIIRLAEEEKARKAKENVSDSDTEQLDGQMEINDYEGAVPKRVDIEQNAQKTYEEPKIHKKGEPRAAEIHYIKLGASFFEEKAAGIKPFELRLNDRDYRVGDILHEIEYKDGHNTNRYIREEVINILENFTGLQENYCILATKLLTNIMQD